MTRGAVDGAVRAGGGTGAPGRAHGSKALKRRLILVACALLTVGVGVLTACSGNAADTALPAGKKSSTAADGRSALSLTPPTVISHAIANGTARPTVTRAGASATGTAQRSSPPAGTSSQRGGPALPDPSGANPLTALAGFTVRYTQEFNGDGIPSAWDAYSGAPGGVSLDVADWVPGMCTFSGGEAHFAAIGVESCGLEYYGAPQEYGAWFARLKGDSEPSGMLFSNIFLLWPANNQWPPEIDIYEDNGYRSNTRATLINTVGSVCGSSPTSQCLQPYEQSNGPSGGLTNDGTQWHTYGVEWTPSGVSWLIDGRVIYTAPASEVKSPSQQPALPMYMAVQSQNMQGAGTPTQRETMTVDWVEEFSWNG